MKAFSQQGLDITNMSCKRLHKRCKRLHEGKLRHAGVRMKEELGIGFIGCGGIARAHAHAVHTINHIAPQSQSLRLVAVSGRQPESAERAAREQGFDTWTTNWREVIEHPDVDVVANLAPNDLHASASISALELGKPVLCEKPLARNADETRQMMEAATVAGIPAACAFNYRYLPAVRLALELAGGGQLGALRHFRASYMQDWAGSPTLPRTWRFAADGNASGAVGDYAHIANLLLAFAGKPRSVTAHTTTLVPERPDPEAPDRSLPVQVEDAYAAIFDLEGGGLGTLESSMCATGWKGRQRIEISGTAGSLWWDMEDLNRLHLFLLEDERAGLGGFRDLLVTQPEQPYMRHWWAPGHVLGWEHSFVHLWLSFIAAVLDGHAQSDLVTFDEGHRVAIICDAILEAASTGQRIDLGDRWDLN